MKKAQPGMLTRFVYDIVDTSIDESVSYAMFYLYAVEHQFRGEYYYVMDASLSGGTEYRNVRASINTIEEHELA